MYKVTTAEEKDKIKDFHICLYDHTEHAFVRACVRACACVCLETHRLVHLELNVVLVAEQLVGPGRGELLGGVCEQQEVVEEKRPQLLVALGLVHLDSKRQ